MKTTAEIRRGAELIAQEAMDRIAELTVEEDRIKAEIQELRALARRYSPTTNNTATRNPRSQGSPSRPYYASGRRIAQVAGIIQERYSDDAFTVRDIVEQIPGVSEPSIRAAILKLRELQAIRAAERDRVAGSTTPSQFYRTMNLKKLEALAQS